MRGFGGRQEHKPRAGRRSRRETHGDEKSIPDRSTPSSNETLSEVAEQSKATESALVTAEMRMNSTRAAARWQLQAMAMQCHDFVVTHPNAVGRLRDLPVLGDSQEQGAVLRGDAPLSFRWEGQRCHSSLEIEAGFDQRARNQRWRRNATGCCRGRQNEGTKPLRRGARPCTAPALGLCRMHSEQFFRQVNHFL